MSFITDAELREGVVSALKLANPSSLPAAWDKAITDGNAMAYADITNAFITRGYTTGQIDTWTRGPIVQKLQGMYWAFTLAAGIHNFDDRWVNKWDQRKYLETTALEDAGGMEEPGMDPPLVQVGLLWTDNDKWDECNMRW